MFKKNLKLLVKNYLCAILIFHGESHAMYGSNPYHREDDNSCAVGRNRYYRQYHKSRAMYGRNRYHRRYHGLGYEHQIYENGVIEDTFASDMPAYYSAVSDHMSAVFHFFKDNETRNVLEREPWELGSSLVEVAQIAHSHAIAASAGQMANSGSVRINNPYACCVFIPLESSITADEEFLRSIVAQPQGSDLVEVDKMANSGSVRINNPYACCVFIPLESSITADEEFLPSKVAQPQGSDLVEFEKFIQEIWYEWFKLQDDVELLQEWFTPECKQSIANLIERMMSESPKAQLEDGSQDKRFLDLFNEIRKYCELGELSEEFDMLNRENNFESLIQCDFLNRLKNFRLSIEEESENLKLACDILTYKMNCFIDPLAYYQSR